ncbi:sulfite exporter TauE/SafE family protein [Maridesulfovibrio sp.]|uniref:sulfite exporter TauE/SafE family protein n=1 Tax=Maridesulfovibrio sp. TaxID=2795000 RepID=UPI002A18C2BF|nr:sulfite exporter TauE/SafE family protein [Maridesulfovibrio sp.]
MSPFAAVPVIFFAAGFLQGITGFGAALIAMPLLAYVVDIKVAVPACTMCGVFINMNMAYKLRDSLEFRRIMPLVAGCVPGVIFGTLILKEVDGYTLRLMLGLLVTGFALYSLRGKSARLRLGDRWGYPAGFLTGAINSAISAGGPPTIIFLTMRGYDRDTFRATLVGFFLFAGAMAAFGHLVSGMTTMYVFKLFLVSALPIVAGTYLGNRISGRIPEDFYKRMVMTLLVFMGLMLIFQNV